MCDYAVNVDCLGAEGFYSLNDNFGAVIAEERSDDEGFEEEAFEDEDVSRKWASSCQNTFNCFCYLYTDSTK